MTEILAAGGKPVFQGNSLSCLYQDSVRTFYRAFILDRQDVGVREIPHAGGSLGPSKRKKNEMSMFPPRPWRTSSDYSAATSDSVVLGGLRKSSSSILPNTAVAMLARCEAMRLK